MYYITIKIMGYWQSGAHSHTHTQHKVKCVRLVRCKKTGRLCVISSQGEIVSSSLLLSEGAGEKLRAATAFD